MRVNKVENMNRLAAFLHPAKLEEQKEIFISERFCDESGKPVPFIIKALSQAENEAIGKKCLKGEKWDDVEYTQRLVVAATVEPDFSDKELLAAFSPDLANPLLDPLQLPGRMLRTGEYARLVNEIMKLSGFDKDMNVAAKNF